MPARRAARRAEELERSVVEPRAQLRKRRRLVRRGIRAWNERDVGTAEALLHPDFEYQGQADWPGLPRAYRGREEFLRRIALIDDELEGFRNEPVEFIDAGERVVVVSQMSATGRRSGAPVAFSEAFVYTIAAGRITRMEACGTRERALTVGGVGE